MSVESPLFLLLNNEKHSKLLLGFRLYCESTPEFSGLVADYVHFGATYWYEVVTFQKFMGRCTNIYLALVLSQTLHWIQELQWSAKQTTILSIRGHQNSLNNHQGRTKKGRPQSQRSGSADAKDIGNGLKDNGEKREEWEYDGGVGEGQDRDRKEAGSI